MREFVVKKGKFAGIHKIYASDKECIKEESVSSIRKPWSHPDAKVGEWCRLDDGFIMQLLRRSKLIDKKYGHQVDVYRFAHGSRPIYHRKRDNQRVAPLWYTTNPSSNKSAVVSEGYDRQLSGTYDKRKRLWVELVAGGMDPLEATTAIYREGVANLKPNARRLLSMSNKLIKDTKVREHLMEALKPFTMELQEQIAKATGGKTLIEVIALDLAKLANTTPKSMKDTISKIKLMLDIAELKGDIVKKPTSPKAIRDAQVAEYEEIKPPALGVNDK